MTKFMMLFVLATTALSTWAKPNLDLIKDKEWKGTCRKVENEAHQEVKDKRYKRLQSSYSFQNGELIWWVKSFADTSCTKLVEATKNTLNCEITQKAHYAKCKQIKFETSKTGLDWTSQPMVDHSGKENLLELEVKVAATKNKTVKITTIGETEDPETETLTAAPVSTEAK